MKVLVVLLSWLGMASAFLLSQAPGRGLTAHHLSAAASSMSTPSGDLVQFRPALPEELGAIRGVLAGMLMNPLSIDVKNFICAEEEGALVGFGQVCNNAFAKYYIRLYYSEYLVNRFRFSLMCRSGCMSKYMSNVAVLVTKSYLLALVMLPFGSRYVRKKPASRTLFTIIHSSATAVVGITSKIRLLGGPPRESLQVLVVQQCSFCAQVFNLKIPCFQCQQNLSLLLVVEG